MRDATFPANCDNGLTVTYYVGHPTVKKRASLSLKQNHAASITARSASHRVYPVFLHLPKGRNIDKELGVGKGLGELYFVASAGKELRNAMGEHVTI